jgi:hypothetical protein
MPNIVRLYAHRLAAQSGAMTKTGRCQRGERPNRHLSVGTRGGRTGSRLYSNRDLGLTRRHQIYLGRPFLRQRNIHNGQRNWTWLNGWRIFRRPHIKRLVRLLAIFFSAFPPQMLTLGLILLAMPTRMHTLVRKSLAWHHLKPTIVESIRHP